MMATDVEVSRRNEKKDVEESLQVGRKWGQIWGTLKRAEPDLMQYLEQLEKELGVSKYEIVKEALQQWVRIKLYRQSGLSVAELYQAFLILRDLLSFVKDIYISYASSFFNEYNRSFAELVRQSVEEKMKAMEEVKKKEKELEEEKAKKSAREVLDKKIVTLTDIATNIATNMLIDMMPLPRHVKEKALPKSQIKVTVEGV